MEPEQNLPAPSIIDQEVKWVQVIRGFLRVFPIILLFTPLVFLIPFLTQFLFPGSGVHISDLTISHYPNAIFLLNSLREWGAIPLWSGTILIGYPFFANPLAGLWYTPGWLALLLPLPMGFNLLVGLHLVWGGWGLYRLMRLEGLSKPAALLAGLSFACLPKLFSHYGAGHLTLLYAIPWTPWLLVCQALSPVLSVRRLRISIPPGLILALIFLADPRWALFAGGLWWAYALSHRHAQSLAVILKRLILQTGLAALLAAPLALPLLEYTRLSTRSSLQVSDISAFSLPLTHLVGLLFPDPGGFHEFILYPGAIGLLLILVVWLVKRPLGGSFFWSVILGLSLLFSLGGNLPGFEQLTKLPGFDLLRVPSRALFLSGFSMAALAGYGLDVLLHPLTPHNRRRVRLGSFALIFLTLVIVLGLSIISGQVIPEIVWGLAFLFLAGVWIWMWLTKRVSRRWWFAGVFGLCLLNLAFFDLQSFKTRPVADVLSESQDVARYLQAQSGLFRVYSPSYSLPQQTAARAHLSLADGIDPLQLTAYVDYMNQATGVPSHGYSVTVPPFATGNTLDNAGYVPDAQALGLLNVAFLASEFEVDGPGWVYETKYDNTWLYRNLDTMPRAWVQPAYSQSNQAIQPAQIIRLEPNELMIEASGQGQLILAEVNYPGWQAAVDGEPVPIETYANLLRSISLTTGHHQITFTFRPLSLYLGLAACLLGVLIFIFWSMRILDYPQTHEIEGR